MQAFAGGSAIATATPEMDMPNSASAYLQKMKPLKRFHTAWVNKGKAQKEHMFFRFVPNRDRCADILDRPFRATRMIKLKVSKCFPVCPPKAGSRRCLIAVRATLPARRVPGRVSAKRVAKAAH